MLGVYTIVEATNYGWGSAHTLGFGAGALALLAGFVVREARAANPLVPLRIFRSRNLSGANVIQALMVAGMFGMFFLGALYLQRVLGFDSLEVGLAFLPVTALIGILSLGFSARLNLRFGARATLLPGLVADRRRAAALLADRRRRQLLDRSAAGDGAGRHRRRALVPVADDPGDVRRAAGGGRPRLRPGQHDPAGRRRPRARRAGDAVDQPHRPTWSPAATPRRTALTSGYQLAFLIAAGLLIVVAGRRRGLRHRAGRGPAEEPAVDAEDEVAELPQAAFSSEAA